jgi:DNA-directed RNA polymerase subunit beta'
MLIVTGRHMVVSIEDGDGRTRQTFKPTYGTALSVKDKKKVKPGDKIADWDPFAQPMISEVEGIDPFGRYCRRSDRARRNR